MKSKVKIRTACLCCSILLISILLLLIQNNKSGNTVVINVDGNKTYYSLNVNQTIDLNTNIVVIEDNTVYMKEANCPDLICIKQGKIKLKGQTITCLPNKITVSILSDDLDIIQ